MSPTFYHILHVSSALALVGGTFYAFAAPAETRKKVLMLTGIASLLILVSGIGLLHKLQYGFPGWAIAKIGCWLGLSAFAGVAYRRRAVVPALVRIALLLAFAAVVLVYTKPF